MRYILSAILSLLCALPVVAVTLSGFISNSDGRVGFRATPGGKVTHVYKTAKAYGLLYEGDVVISCDGHKGMNLCEGRPAGSIAHLVVVRVSEFKELDIERTAKENVHD